MERYNEIFNIAVEYVKSKMEKRIFKNTQEKNLKKFKKGVDIK